MPTCSHFLYCPYPHAHFNYLRAERKAMQRRIQDFFKEGVASLGGRQTSQGKGNGGGGGWGGLGVCLNM